MGILRTLCDLVRGVLGRSCRSRIRGVVCIPKSNKISPPFIIGLVSPSVLEAEGRAKSDGGEGREHTAFSICCLAPASIWEDVSWGYVIITWRDAPLPMLLALSPVKRRVNNVSIVEPFIAGAFI